jgi:hypothetical protein
MIGPMCWQFMEVAWTVGLTAMGSTAVTAAMAIARATCVIAIPEQARNPLRRGAGCWRNRYRAETIDTSQQAVRVGLLDHLHAGWKLVLLQEAAVCGFRARDFW